MKSLHVGLNCHFMKGDAGGSGTYARELIRAIHRVEPDTRFTVYVTRDAPAWFLDEPWGGEVEMEFMPGSVGRAGIGDGVAAVAAQWLIQPYRAARSEIDVVHSLAYIGAPVSRVPTVVTILDLIWHHHPGAMSRRNTALMRVFARVSAARASRIIAISEAAKCDLVETFGIPAERIDVTLLGSNGAAIGEFTPGRLVRERFGIGTRRFILCAAQKRVHKNLVSLAAAIPFLEDPEAVVVIPGTSTPYEDEVRRVATRFGVEDRLLLPSWVSQEDLEGLFRECSAVALPSLMEGFGLPILEAMERGIPVACSNVSSLPEVAGDAALLFDPRSPKDIGAKLNTILRDGPLVDDMIARGYRRCQELTWDRTARATLESYRRAIARW